MKLTIYFLIFFSRNLVIGAISLKKRIVGGTQAIEGEFPYHASLYMNGSYRCGCALISKYHLVTVAHCVENIVKYGWSVTVIVGSIRLNVGTSHNVSRVSYHPGFSRGTEFFFLYDIAVIHLLEPVKISVNISVIALPVPFAESENEQVIISGYSCALMGLPLSTNLMRLETETISLKECQEAFNNFVLAKTNICTSREVGYGCCYSDSGNALVDKTKSTLIGILSVSTGSCGAGIPDVYTKISHLTSYIEEEMEYDVNKEYYLNEYTSINFVYPDKESHQVLIDSISAD